MSKTLMGSANNLMPARCSCPAAKRRFSTAQSQTGETVDRRTKRRGVLERLAGAFLKFADPVEQDSGARLAVHSPFVADSRSRKNCAWQPHLITHSPLFPSSAGKLWSDLKKTVTSQQLGKLFRGHARVANYRGGRCTRMVPLSAMSADELPT